MAALVFTIDMKSTLLSSTNLLFSLVLMLGQGCSKSDLSTTLKLTVVDSVGNPVKGARVSLFDNGLDYLNQEKKIGASQTSGVDGIVYFSNLKPQGYFWSARKGCASNYYHKAGTFDALKANETNPFTAEITAVGSVRIINNSSNAYGITCSNADPDALVQKITTGTSGNDTTSIGFLPLETFLIRIVQQTATVPNPFDKTFTVTVKCDTITLTIP